MNNLRKVVAINQETGERKEFDGTYQAAKFLKTSTQNVTQALERCGACCGWAMYDSADRIRQRIEMLQEMLCVVEG